TVDRWQRTCYCLMSDVLLVIHLNTGRVLQEIPLGGHNFRVVWGQDGIIGVYDPEQQQVKIFNQSGMRLDILPGTLLVSDRGVAVSQLHNKETILLYASSGVHHLQAGAGTSPIGVFETPTQWLILTAS
ncbi:MAG: hypothetical protein QXS54_10830, partial [Candidatus Methanomethylicaceae archaeon]